MIQTLKGFNRNRTVTLKIIYSDPLIKLKKYTDTYTSLGAGIDKNGLPVTGLTEDKKVIGPKGGTSIITGTRKAMEAELDLVEGSLKQTSAYWVNYNIRIGTDDIRLDLEAPHDLLKYLFAVAQSNVASSLKEIESNSKAEFVLFSTEQEAEAKVTARSSLKRAYVLADSLDLETKMNLLNVYGFIVDASEINTIENKINEQVEADPDKFLQLADDELLIYKSLITKALDKGILSLKDGAIYHGEVVVGYDKDAASAAIAKDKRLTVILKAKLSGDMDLIRESLEN